MNVTVDSILHAFRQQCQTFIIKLILCTQIPDKPLQPHMEMVLKMIKQSHNKGHSQTDVESDKVLSVNFTRHPAGISRRRGRFLPSHYKYNDSGR